MITAEISIIPIGTTNTSVSEYIAEAEKVLDDNYPHLDKKLTAMATQISGHSLDDIFDALKDMHMAVLQKGSSRVSTSIRIDDRRDKESNMEDKIASVESKM